MLHPPEDGKIESWHRFYASTANNRAWELAESQADARNDGELLNAAHASAWHWQAVGTELNHMRAKMLLAQVYALIGRGEIALRYADEMKTYFLAQSETPDWELAFVHTIHARAAWAAGDRQQHARSYAAATAALGAIADEEDRAIVQRTYAQVPIP
jgi:hypothetical protein